ncbi:hypothetical protein ACHAWF_010186 [Thalassiosira exigua]
MAPAPDEVRNYARRVLAKARRHDLSLSPGGRGAVGPLAASDAYADDDEGESEEELEVDDGLDESGITGVDSAESLGFSLKSSAGSLPTPKFPDETAAAAYDPQARFDDAHLEEFAKVASPKVSEMLHEQALALDELLRTPGWGSDDDDDDYGGGTKKKGARGSAGRRGESDDDDDDSIHGEWGRLGEAERGLREELNAVTSGLAQTMGYGDGSPRGDCGAEYPGRSDGAGWEAAGGEEAARRSRSEEFRDSVHRYYAAHSPRGNGPHGSSPHSNTPNGNGAGPGRSPGREGHAYALSDHALALDVVPLAVPRRGRYAVPLLSRHELETSGVVTLPAWVIRPGGGVPAHGRDAYVRRVLDCASEHLEPIRARNLRKWYGGWIPGPGERRAEDARRERTSAGGGGDARQRVVSYSPSPASPVPDVGESSSDEEEDGGGYEDVDGTVAHGAAPRRRPTEPLPVRTVAMRIRPDVLCGAVTDALTTSAEGCGGEITKRQGGVSRHGGISAGRRREESTPMRGSARTRRGRREGRPKLTCDLCPPSVSTASSKMLRWFSASRWWFGHRYAPSIAAMPKLARLSLPLRRCSIALRCRSKFDVFDRRGSFPQLPEADSDVACLRVDHLRAVLPGQKLPVQSLGHREGGPIDGHTVPDAASPPGGYGSSCSPACPAGGIDDASSVASGLSAVLSLSSPILGSRPKRPTHEVLPPCVVDAQLVTTKAGRECQRLVLIRIYRLEDVVRARLKAGEEEDEEALDMLAPLDATDGDGAGGSHGDRLDGGQDHAVDPLLEGKRNLAALKEASALVQRIKAVGGKGFAIDPPQSNHDGDAPTVASHSSTKSYLKSFGDAITSPIRYLSGSDGATPSKTSSNFSSRYPTVMDLMSSELQRNFTPSPSVGTRSRSALAAAKRKSHGIFPSLSAEDAPYIRSSWAFLRDCVEELDRRCLAYSTLGLQPVFQFPALPTLDVHFISQIKAFCRESMIASLVKTASELEVYAREMEASCMNVDRLLRPTFERYGLEPVGLPAPVPLTAYPLDFRAPEEISPPWGPEVMSGLEKISNELTSDAVVNIHQGSRNKSNGIADSPLTSFEKSEKATSIVVAAFQRQNDDEQGARLGRKNMQVMDRLAKMQAHKRDSIAKIRDSYGSNRLATEAADEFHSLRRKSHNVGSLSDIINALPDEVPLLVCNVLVGNSAGTCYITHSHVLFNTQLLPIFGGSRVHLFSIADVEVTINTPPKSMLSSLPASISFTTAVFGGKSTTREEVYNFIPSIGARRFAKFMEVLREVALEDPNSLKFSDKGGLIYLAD